MSLNKQQSISLALLDSFEPVGASLDYMIKSCRCMEY